MSGKVGDLSPKQEAALTQLKDNTKDIVKSHWDDYFYLRWLRARSFDLKKAEKMLRDNVEWRRKWQADELVDWKAPEVIEKYFPGGFMGEDKEGNPLVLRCLGYMDMKGMIYSATKKDLFRHTTKMAEILEKRLLDEQTKKHGRRIDQCTILMDLDHIGLKHLWKPALDMFTESLSIFEANYPELMKVAYIVNAPKIFPIVWNISKPFLHEHTKQKIKVFGRDYKQRLLEVIDADVLPVHWGGKATGPDGDEYCQDKINIGGKIPEKYRLKNIRENIDMSNFENCTVQRGSTVQLDYDVKEPGSSLRWQFLSEGNDIGFGVFRRTSDERQKKGEMEEVVTSERVDSHIVPEEGSVILADVGKYVVRFDNTYSWVNAKKVAYLIDVLAPDQEKQSEVTQL